MTRSLRRARLAAEGSGRRSRRGGGRGRRQLGHTAAPPGRGGGSATATRRQGRCSSYLQRRQRHLVHNQVGAIARLRQHACPSRMQRGIARKPFARSGRVCSDDRLLPSLRLQELVRSLHLALPLAASRAPSAGSLCSDDRRLRLCLLAPAAQAWLARRSLIVACTSFARVRCSLARHLATARNVSQTREQAPGSRVLDRSQPATARPVSHTCVSSTCPQRVLALYAQC